MMLITSAQANEVTKLAVTMFGAAPGAYKEYLDGKYLENGADLVATAAAFGQEPAFGAMYNGTAAENAAKIIANLSIDQISDADLKALAEGYITEQVEAGADLGQLYGFALDYMANNTDGNDFSEALAVIDAKVAVANSFTAGYGANVTNLDILMDAIAGVTADTDVEAFVFANLTAESDVIFGDAQDNIFEANLAASGFGGSVDTLQSDDYINGGAGFDTLNVTLANTPFGITPETDSVEAIYVRSQSDDGNDDSDNDTGDNNKNTIDAQDLNGMSQFWNSDSRASLEIEDIRNNSHETTIAWQSADSGEDMDYEVYFNSPNITAPDADASGSQLFLEILDLDSAAADTGPLANNPYVGVVITVGGEEVSIVGEDPITTSYDDLIAGLNASLAAQGLDSIVAEAGVEFQKFNSDDGQLYTGTTIVLTNSGSEELGSVGWTTGGDILPADTNIHTSITDEAPTAGQYLTQTNIILDDVGRGSKSGDMLVGNMSTGDHSDSQGIQQFNVTVDRDSWLNTLSTTNNGLEVINVVNTGANGSLTIDNGEGAGIQDVRVFDASAMTGDVTLAADLNDDIVAKYLNLTDDAADGTADNSEENYITVVDKEFSYDMGAGDDSLDINVEGQAIAHEDFVLNIEGNGGDDSITTSFGMNAGEYADHAVLGNLSIDAGAGDDTVTTGGIGNVVIAAGAGNDTVYTDNSGNKATWELQEQIAAPLSDPSILYKSTITVTYNGGSGGVIGDAIAAEADNGFESTVTVETSGYLGNEQNVNQAIKKAINEDAVLSKLLLAEDGPSNSLVITSLVDGTMVDQEDLNIELKSFAGTLTAAEETAIEDAYQALIQDSTDATDAATILTDARDAMHAVYTATDGDITTGITMTNAGSDGNDDTVNTVNLGTGDDVLVLSTGDNAETVEFTGSSIGNNTIVNFALAADVLDFTAYLNNVVSASGSTDSQQAIAVTVSAATVDAGEAAVSENQVVVLSTFVADGAETWSAMTAADLLAAIKAANTGTDDYGNIDDGALDLAAADGDLVGDDMKSIVMIENNANDGEYKVFELTASADAGEFTAATLLGTVDFGDSIDATVALAGA